MRVVWFESVGGASGDMLLGALAGCGLDWDAFRRPLEAGVPDLRILCGRDVVHGMEVVRVWCEGSDDAPERHLAEVLSVVEGLDLPSSVRARAAEAFERLAVVEAGAHGCSVDEIHFHELGALDSIMDVVGFFWALHLLGVERVEASPLRLGSGSVRTDHGLLPVPVPAVAGLVRGLPVVPGPGEGELTTPTGALLLAASAESFGPMPPMRVLACGTGAGQRATPWLNVHRAWLGEVTADAVVHDTAMLETNLDDVTGEALGYLRERLEALGALDVTVLTGVGKKGRPVHLVRVLVPTSLRDAAVEALLTHTPALGVRVAAVERVCLERRMETVEVEGARIRVKVAVREGRVLRREPEYEDCAAVARATGRPLADVMDEARRRSGGEC